MTYLSSIRVALLGVMLMALAACGGYTKDQRQNAEALPVAIETVNSVIATKEQEFGKSLKADPELATYLTRERVAASFTKARAEKARAQGLFETDVQPILKRNDEKELSQLDAAVARVNTALTQARQLAAVPGDRFMRLSEAKNKSKDWPDQVKRLAASAETDYSATSLLVERYKKTYPLRQTAIAGRFAPGQRFLAIVRTNAATVASQQALRASGGPVDYAVFADSHAAVVDGQRELANLRLKLAKDLPSLDRSYSKVLVDQKVDYSACVSRTSWYEGETEYPTETPYDYPCVPVSEAIFDTAEGFDDADADFATYSRSWGSWSMGFKSPEAETQALWNQLGLDPGASMPSSDNDSTFWVRDAVARYYHKYTYVENGVRRDGGWEEVTPELFEEHWDDLGMAIVEKPFGAFEDEAVKTASPPGMALVGDPKSGEWKNDSNGHSFWIWHPIYYHSYGSYYGPGWGGYSRADWDGYQASRRSGDGYYGSGGRTYGTAGSSTQTGPLRGSDFAKRGGFKEATSEIRTAGPNGRSDGPQSGK